MAEEQDYQFGPSWKMIGTRDGKGRQFLWHPDSPGMAMWVRPCWLRRVGVIRSPFATNGEVLRYYRKERKRWLKSRPVRHVD